MGRINKNKKEKNKLKSPNGIFSQLRVFKYCINIIFNIPNRSRNIKYNPRRFHPTRARILNRRRFQPSRAEILNIIIEDFTLIVAGILNRRICS